METTLEKIRFIESDAVPRKGVKIKALGSTVAGKKGQSVTRATSLQTTYSCGCVPTKVSRITTDAKPNIATI